MINDHLEPELLSEYRDRLRGRKALRFVDSVDLSLPYQRRCRALYELDHGFVAITEIGDSTWDPSQSDLEFFETRDQGEEYLTQFVQQRTR